MVAKRIVLSKHALEQMPARGATREEVETAIASGERIMAKSGRVAYRKNFSFEARWKNRYYEIKQVMPIVIEEGDKLVVVTVYAFYFGGPG
ncbi:MAG: DUF4258 domain-containing protein [Dehalococcoidia bacterium]|nr:DUF4258 domain-containing protein [Dehalococcoidia bacterium]